MKDAYAYARANGMSAWIYDEYQWPSGRAFGMVLDGSERVDNILRKAMIWDVMAGVARRSWARNPGSVETCKIFNEKYEYSRVTMPNIADFDKIMEEIEKRS